MPNLLVLTCDSHTDVEQPRFNIETATTPPTVPPILLPQQPPPHAVPSPSSWSSLPQDGSTHRFQQNPPPPWAFTTTATSTESPRTGHPTLIPFEPSIDDVDESEVKSDVTEAPPVIYSTIVKVVLLAPSRKSAATRCSSFRSYWL